MTIGHLASAVGRFAGAVGIAAMTLSSNPRDEAARSLGQFRSGGHR